MFSSDDTIVAVATPPGKGALGVVRISGSDALQVAAGIMRRPVRLAPRRATFVRIQDVDEVVITFFESPRSYTGENVIEISAHGSQIVLQALVDAAIRAGARLAEPGEFTLRAFVRGRLDLIQAEAVADLIDAVTPLQARAAFDQLEGTLTREVAAIDAALFDLRARLEASLDFPEEGYHFIARESAAQEIRDVRERLQRLAAAARRGRLVREGARIVILGKTNVGKSSVFNNLCGTSRVIVTDQPGTTRDMVSERVDINGVPLTLVDTAGLRDAHDAIEREGIERARGAAAVASLLLVIVDRSRPLDADDRAVLGETAGRARVIVANKSDLPASHAWAEWSESTDPILEVSAQTGDGMDGVRSRIIEELAGTTDFRDTPAVSNLRHASLLETAAAALAGAENAATRLEAPEEFILSDLQVAQGALEEITGRRAGDDLLHHIFDRFCVGK